MLYVVAGALREAREYAKDHGYGPKEFLYVAESKVMLGRKIGSEDEVVFTGTWSFRSDIEDIWNALQVSGWEAP